MNIFTNNPDLFPTPTDVIARMLFGYNIAGKVVLEPSAGTGNIVDYVTEQGAKEVLMCELMPTMKKLLVGKGRFLTDDFLELTKEQISHVDAIIMNPPFSEGVKHLLHAIEIAPAGCYISCLLNHSNISNDYTKERKELKVLIGQYGQYTNLKDCFSTAERNTYTEIALVQLYLPASNSGDEFEGFFEEEDVEAQANGLMSYNLIRDVVNRYVAAVKIFDQQLVLGIQMNNILYGYYGLKLSFTATSDSAPIQKDTFKKELQKEGWQFVFKKLNLNNLMTKGVKEKINKFVEMQSNIPFTMRNIYHMLDIVMQTRSQNYDEAIVEVFEKLTKHTAENRFMVEGWKTNSHYLINKKFIFPYICPQDRYNKGGDIDMVYSGNGSMETIDDLVKALCYLTGENYAAQGELRNYVRYPIIVKTKNKFEYFSVKENYSGSEKYVDELKAKGVEYELINKGISQYGTVFEWSFFRCKCFKKGTMHLEFINEDVWAKLNQNIARIKGYPLYEYRSKTKYQEKQYQH